MARSRGRCSVGLGECPSGAPGKWKEKRGHEPRKSLSHGKKTYLLVLIWATTNGSRRGTRPLISFWCDLPQGLWDSSGSRTARGRARGFWPPSQTARGRPRAHLPPGRREVVLVLLTSLPDSERSCVWLLTSLSDSERSSSWFLTSLPDSERSSSCSSPDGRAVRGRARGASPLSRTVRSSSWSSPDAWAVIGRARGSSPPSRGTRGRFRGS